MTYFDQAPKAKLREYQRLSTIKRKEAYNLKYKIALLLFEEMKNIHYVAKYFNVTRDAAYKMVRRGKELKKGI